MGMSHTNPIHILLVEDDEDDHRLVCDLLSDLITSGSTLRWVPDYDEALSVLLTGEFAVCLLDYRLGDRDGIELLEQAARSGCPTPIIFLSGAGNLDLDYTAMKTGAADYLTKDQLSATLLLSVSDDGVGLPTDFDLNATSTLGIRLVSRLAAQLGGRLEVEAPGNGGACFRVVFPVPAGSSFGEKS